jgi:beta-barrel assembly-enhancing protease
MSLKLISIFRTSLAIAAFSMFALVQTSCDKNGKVNFLSVQQDKELGMQTAAQIEADVAQFPILDEAQNASAYAYLRGIKDKILNSGKIKYKDEFVWQVKIINDANTLNAFCTPGGYIYVYTGLIKYLDNADQLAGVMGHEMGHADLRHTSRNITQQYGYDIVLQVLTGGQSNVLVQIASQLKDLRYSRAYETEADDASVTYLSATEYACNGAAGFFEKIKAMGERPSNPMFSTHPSDESRIQNINEESTKIGCRTTATPNDGYAAFKNSLP